MAIAEWRVIVVVICVALLLLHEALWQWWWWTLDSTDTSSMACSGNQILVSNDSKTVICQPCPICSAGMTLSPPCGSILTFDTVIKCTSILMKLPGENKRKKSTKSKLLTIKLRFAGPQKENFIARSSLDVHDIYYTVELEDSNLSDMAGFQELFGPSSSTQDFQGMTPTPSTKYSFSNAVSHLRQRRVHPKFPTSKRTVPRPIPNPVKEESWEGQFTTPIPVPEQMKKMTSNITAEPQGINISCLFGGFLGTSLAWLLLVTALVCIWFLLSFTRTIHAKTWNKKRRGYNRLNSTEESKADGMSYVDGSVDYINATNPSNAVATADLKHLKLSELPPDLEDLLVKKLDVRRKGERLYGWQKVGVAFKIPSVDLDYLELQYERISGSPTKELLSILGISKDKTLYDLVNSLKSRKVRLPDVASLINRYIKAASKIQ